MTGAGDNETQPPARGATRATAEALLDRRVFRLDAAQYEAFKRALDAPPRPSAALRELLARPASWER